jgi:hypothetical protein
MTTELELLETIAEAERKLYHLGVVRGGRVAGDYAEWLIQKALGGKRPTSQAQRGFDLVLPDNSTTIQVKGRRETADRKPTHWDFTSLKVKEGGKPPFHRFIGIVFDHDFHVNAAYQEDFATVKRLANTHGSKHRLRVGDLERDRALTAELRQRQGLK